MKPPPPPAKAQLNLPLLTMSACVLPQETQAELILAIVELLIGAAREPVEHPSQGGANECEAHR
jgi:hypothetical protein